MCPDKTWSKYEKHCYHLLTDKNTVDDCRQECVQLGGDLASIHSVEENEFVTSLIRDRILQGEIRGAWIGGKYSQSQAEYLWFDKSEWDFVNWKSGYPNSVNTIGKWSCVLGKP